MFCVICSFSAGPLASMLAAVSAGQREISEYAANNLSGRVEL